MIHRVRPDVVVFDVVETLSCLDLVADRLLECHQPEELLARWFTRLVRDGMALTAAGSYAGFADVAASALHAETRHALSGLTTGWCPRLEGQQTPVFATANVVADTLDGVITALAALSAPGGGE